MGRLKTPVLAPTSKRGKRPDTWKKAGPAPFVVVQLTERHTINGVPYGPGEVRVREHLARALMDTEQRIRDNLQNFLNPKSAQIMLGYGSPRIKLVPSGYFDAHEQDVLKGHAEPSFQFSPRDLR